MVVGDVMADATGSSRRSRAARSRILERLGVEPGEYLLVTVHREANVRPERLARIVEGLNRLEEPIVFPVHPRTRAALERLGPRGFELIPPAATSTSRRSPPRRG